jgi:hypothetical protein
MRRNVVMTKGESADVFYHLSFWIYVNRFSTLLPDNTLPTSPDEVSGNVALTKGQNDKRSSRDRATEPGCCAYLVELAKRRRWA